MKNFFTLSVFLMLISALNAQYFQNFDSYSYGEYIGLKDPAWTTWNNSPGTSEDAKIDTLQSNSPNNSIYFQSTSPNGGPQDVILKFGNAFSTGSFEYHHAMYVQQNRGAYFNFQAETTIGSQWALNCNFINDSTLQVDDGTNIHFITEYPVETWFIFKLLANFNTNTWEVYIDNVLKGSFQNGVNKIASIDIFPLCRSGLGGNNQSNFWIDDVYFKHTPYTLPTLNASITSIGFNNVTIVGTSNKPVIEIKNLGTTIITSLGLEINYNGSQVQKNVSNIVIPSLGTYEVTFSPGITLVNGADSITASITSVNGTNGDDDPSDDNKTVHFNPIIPAQGKIVIVEEATGTWCGWCPRGAVALEFLAKDYHEFAQGIAVHNNDPMEDSVYDAGIGNMISGYPSALVNRGNTVNPSAIWDPVNEALEAAPTAILVNGAKMNNGAGHFDVSLSVTFNAAADNNWKIACVLIEDSIKGTTSDYSQSNYYSGGGSGDLIAPDGTNWANLPNPVPASQMVYNHVARAISPHFTGYKGFPASVNPSDTHTFNFTFQLDNSWDTANMHIVGMLIKPNGKIDNGSTSSIAEALKNGFVPGTQVSIAKYLKGPDNEFKVYPNPFKDFVSIELEKPNKNVTIEIRNSIGQLVYSNYIENCNKTTSINFDNNPGIYFLHVIADDEIERTFKLIKQ